MQKARGEKITPKKKRTVNPRKDEIDDTSITNALLKGKAEEAIEDITKAFQFGESIAPPPIPQIDWRKVLEETQVKEVKERPRKMKKRKSEDDLVDMDAQPDEQDEEVAKVELEKKEKNQIERDEQAPRTIFVGNLPTNQDFSQLKKELRKFFGECGKIDSMRFRSAVVGEKKKNKRAAVIKEEFGEDSNSINAYIVFESEESIPAALKMNQTQFLDKTIRVDTETRQETNPHLSIFLGNLPFDVTEEEVKKAFEPCGTIQDIRLVRDSQTRKGKGFGFVTFEKVPMARKALKQKIEIKGRDIRISPGGKQDKNDSKGPAKKQKTRAEAKKKSPAQSSWAGTAARKDRRPKK
eukprot:TRINITY_DN3306_c0_g1_i2.p1 TRINITY_DN3306_c0_g1~~TRINITY_DN3306_c0_g1_i2.p1  ORF type:complete len:352 (+),score=110.15 TRINITY_DN3306_c0_g1_i2:51-1106(+)